jgi:hypothetical protein
MEKERERCEKKWRKKIDSEIDEEEFISKITFTIAR